MESEKRTKDADLIVLNQLCFYSKLQVGGKSHP